MKVVFTPLVIVALSRHHVHIHRLNLQVEYTIQVQKKKRKKRREGKKNPHYIRYNGREAPSATLMANQINTQGRQKRLKIGKKDQEKRMKKREEN